ncbi:WD domain, G-beta repeat-containing protein, partial [Toxoplasma gondii FOU]
SHSACIVRSRFALRPPRRDGCGQRRRDPQVLEGFSGERRREASNPRRTIRRFFLSRTESLWSEKSREVGRQPRDRRKRRHRIHPRTRRGRYRRLAL